MPKRTQELSKPLKRRLGCKDIDCLEYFEFFRHPKCKLTKKAPCWEFTGRCTKCPKVITLSDAMMRSVEKCIGAVDVKVIAPAFDAMFGRS